MRRGAAIISAEEKPPNPIYKRFTLGSGWPSMRQARWLAVGLALACAMLVAWLLSLPNYHRLLYSLILLSGIVAISPVLFSIYAANLAHRLTGTIDYRMIQLSPLADVDILEGVTLTALFQVRLPRAITTGLAPVVVLLLTIIFGWNYRPEYALQILTFVIGVEHAVVVWIAQWVSISLGVNFALHGDSRWGTMFLTVWIALLMSAALYFLGGFVAPVLTVLALLMAMPID